VEARTSAGDPEVPVRVRPLARSTLESFLGYRPDGWVSVTSLVNLRLDREGLVLHCGEGSLGADGFVAVREIAGPLRWAAFFQSSNPFRSVTLEGEHVVALSTLDHRWSFPLERPEHVQVTWATAREGG